MRLSRFRIRSLMLLVLLAAILLSADQLRRRRESFLAKARELARLEQAERALALAELARAKDRLRWAERMFSKTYVSQGQVTAEQLNVRKAEFAVQRQQANTELRRRYEYAADHPWLSLPVDRKPAKPDSGTR